MITDEEKELLRGDQHHSRHYASFLRPLTLWTARVNNGSIARGAITIAFDGGSGLDWNAVEAIQTLWVGSAAGLGDLGKVRIRAKSSGDSGATGSLTVAANSLPWVDNAYLTFKHNYELDARYPWIDPATEIFYKDRDIAFAGQTEQPEPACVVDIYNQADFVRNGELYFFFTMARSYPMTPGATIDTYACSVYPTSGVAVTIDAGTGVGRIRVTSVTQDYYWAKFTVTDSNGKSQSNYQCLFAHDPIQGRPTYPHNSFNLNQITRAWDRGGCYGQLLMTNNASLEDIPDETFCIIWRLSSYGAALSENLVRVQAGELTYINPQLSYRVSGGPAVGVLDITFTAGILVNGLVPADGLAVNLEIVNTAGTPETPSPTTSGGVITTTVTVNDGNYTPGTIEVSDTDSSVTVLLVDYEAEFPFGKDSGPAPTSSYPSPLWVFPQRFITGYVRKDNLVRNLASGVNQDTLEVTSIEDLLKNHFMYSISLAARPEPATWYEYGSFLTVGRAVHHILKWHSTLLEICSVVGLDRNEDGRAYAEFEDGSLYTMPDQLARQAGIRAHLVCSPTGVLNLTEDSQLLTDAERAVLPVKLELAKEDMSGEMALIRQTEPRVALVHVSGLEFDGNFIPAESIGEPDPKPEVFPYCSMAPGQLPARAGEGVVNVERQVVRSQAHCNELAGRIFAQANNPYPEFRVRFHGDYDALLDPALPELWQVDIIAGDSLREIVLPDLKLILRSTATMFNQGHVFSDAVFEPVAQGNDGVPGVCLDTLPEVGGEPLPIDNDGLPGALVTAGSVYYLPPGTSAWTPRTAEATSFLYQDPWWRIKQASIASANAILIRGGLGYLKRSEDGGATWDTVTPGSVPPGFGGVMGDIEFYDGEGSYLTSDFHVIVARSDDSGNWESWLYISDDDFVTGSWVAVGSEGDPEIIASTVSDVISSISVSNISSAWLRDSLFLILTQTDNGAILLLVDMESGEPVVLDTYTPPYSTFYGPMCRLDSEKALLVITTNHDSDNHIEAYAVDTVGEVIFLSSVTTIETGDSMVSGELVVRNDTGWCALIYVRNFGGLTCQTIEVDLGSLAITDGAQNVIDAAFGYSVTAALIDEDTVLVSYLKDSSEEIECRVVVVAPFSASSALVVGDGIMPATNDLTITEPRLMRATDSSDYFLLVWVEPDYEIQFALIDGSVSPPTIADTAAGPASRQQPAIVRLADNQFVCAYGREADQTVYCRTLSVSGSTLTDNNDEFILNTAGGSAGIFDLVAHNLSGALVAFTGNGPDLDSYYVTFPAISGGEAKALSLSIGRGVGSVVYLTFWTGTHLALKSYLLPAGTDDGTVLLGEATESEVNSGSKIAYVLAGWHDDERFYLFGRFTGPGGLGFPVALAYSPDYGNSWQAIEDGFGANHIGSLRETPDGKLFAVRNLVNQSKLYTGTDSLVVKSTLPFHARVNLRAMTLDWRDNTVVVCSASGLPVMVALSVPPYAVWTDITTNHGTASGVRSVEVL